MYIKKTRINKIQTKIVNLFVRHRAQLFKVLPTSFCKQSRSSSSCHRTTWTCRQPDRVTLLQITSKYFLRYAHASNDPEEVPKWQAYKNKNLKKDLHRFAARRARRTLSSNSVHTAVARSVPGLQGAFRVPRDAGAFWGVCAKEVKCCTRKGLKFGLQNSEGL